MLQTFRNFTLIPILICAFLVIETRGQQLIYPKATRTTHTDNYHGMEVADPYRWMEAAESPDLELWLKAQDELLKNFNAGETPLRTRIETRLSELYVYENYTNSISINTPYVSKRSERYFFIKTPPGESVPALFVQHGATATPKLLIDIKSHFKKDAYNLLGFEPSPDGKHVALFLAARSDRWLTIRIFEVDSGKEMNDVLTGIHRQSGNVSWASDSKGFFYTKFEKKGQLTGQPPVPTAPQIYFHALGDQQSGDTFVFGDIVNDRTRIFPHATSDGRYLVITSVDGSSSHTRVFYKELSSFDAKVKPLFDKADATYTFLGNKKTQFWFFTNRDASRGRVITFDINKDPGNWSETIPQTDDVISASSSVGGNALGMFGDKIVLLYARDSSPILKIFDLKGTLKKEIKLRSGGTIFGGFSGSQNESEVLYQFLDITSPASFYRLDVNTYQNREFLRPKLKLDPGDYETRQVFYTSKDGTRVPMFIAHRKGIKLDGNNPTYMYAYGAAAWVAFMWYQPEMITWMDMGGIYAVPGIRGGGEYGEQWHEAGKGRNKQNAIDDYLAAAEFLINTKHTNRTKLVANGGSGSGATVAAAVMQRPDLFAALLVDRPFLDMLRYDKFGNGKLWVPEFGTADSPDEFKTLISYSPYHNLKKGQCYPPTLVMIGDKDQVTLPFHAFKFVAKMQEVQGCANPVMLKLMKGAGHNFGETPDQRINSWTDALAFLSKVLTNIPRGD